MPPNTGTRTERATIENGTGRFAGATGTFTMVTVDTIDFATAQGDWNWNVRRTDQPEQMSGGPAAMSRLSATVGPPLKKPVSKSRRCTLTPLAARASRHTRPPITAPGEALPAGRS